MTSNDIDTTPDGPAPGQTMTVLFEVTGTGSVYTIDTDPPTDRVQDAPLPWKLELKVPEGIAMLQVVSVGKDSPGPGCRITVDGVVVAEQPVGGSAHCIWTADPPRVDLQARRAVLLSPDSGCRHRPESRGRWSATPSPSG